MTITPEVKALKEAGYTIIARYRDSRSYGYRVKLEIAKKLGEEPTNIPKRDDNGNIIPERFYQNPVWLYFDIEESEKVLNIVKALQPTAKIRGWRGLIRWIVMIVYEEGLVEVTE